MTTEHQSIIIATYLEGICERTMDSFTKSLRETYDWSIDRMNELCNEGEVEDLKNAVSIREEFAEWLLNVDKNLHHDIMSLEYIGEGSEYD